MSKDTSDIARIIQSTANESYRLGVELAIVLTKHAQEHETWEWLLKRLHEEHKRDQGEKRH